jgi:RNA polymerase primary sigma factor
MKVTPLKEEEMGKKEGPSPELVEIRQHAVPAKSGTREPAERTDDPVRLYLREMASVQLLSREGEIAIAKRIEAGREALIAGLCESPLTFQAIIIWRDELNDGKVLLRDIIDLDATYAGPDAKALPTPQSGPDGQIMASIALSGQPGRPPQLPAPHTSPVTIIPLKPTSESTDGHETAAHRMITESNFDDDGDDKERWFSIAAVEAELKPKVIESFDSIAGTYKRCVACRTRTSSSSLEGYRSRLLRSASTRS